MTRPTKSRGSALLVQQDICLRREGADEAVHVVATVECARQACTVRVENCARCAYFARIDVHEAGYVMLCRSEIDEASANTPHTDPEPV